MCMIFGAAEYESMNELMCVLITTLPDEKHIKCGKLWLDLLEKPRSKPNFPDDIQRTVQLYYKNSLISNMLVGPFKKKPNKFADPLYYVAANFSVYDISKMIREKSIKTMRKANPDMKDDTCVGIIQYINRFGLNYIATTKEVFEEKLQQNKIGGATLYIGVATCPKNDSKI